MNSKFTHDIWLIVSLTFLAVLLSSCGKSAHTPQPSPTGIPPTPSPLEPTASPTPLPPSPTPIPLAATVNGEGITLEEYNVELAQYQEAQSISGTNLATTSTVEAKTIVLKDMINQVLLAQAAQQAGFKLDEATLQAHIDQLAAQANLEEWIQGQGYSEQGFRLALSRSIEAAWMRDQILAALPDTAEQVHARQILLYNLDQANQIYSLLQSGQDFARLAAKYDPVSGGDLGWFPRGFLNDPSLEEAAFNLQPGQYSPVIQTRLGYHILQVIERDPERPLDSAARLVTQSLALKRWIEDRRGQSNIQVLIP